MRNNSSTRTGRRAFDVFNYVAPRVGRRLLSGVVGRLNSASCETEKSRRIRNFRTGTARGDNRRSDGGRADRHEAPENVELRKPIAR